MDLAQTKKRLTRRTRLALPLLLLLLNTGCLGQQDINELAIVTAVGIDPGSEPGNVRVTAQIVRPADARGQTGAPSGGTGEPIYSVQAEGSSLFQAIRNLARFSSRRVYWAQNFIIVVNDEYAKQGIGDMIDFFTRNHELRMNTWVAVTPDKASKVVSTVTGLEVIPGKSLDQLFRYNELVGEATRSNMMRLQESYLSASTQPMLAKLQLRKRGISNKKPEEFGSLEQVELSGLAVFRKDKMVGYLTPKEAKAALYFVEKVKSVTEVLSCPDSSDNRVTLEIRHNQFKVTPQMKNGAPRFDVKLVVYADMVENGCKQSLEQMRPELEAAMAEELKADFQTMLDKAQTTYKTDFLKLGETFANRYPWEWRAISQDWKTRFPNVDIAITTAAHIKSPVLMTRTTQPDQGEE